MSGIFTLAEDAYHALPQLSSSLAKTIIAKSPKHAWTESPRLNPDYESEEREEFDYGKACHALLLEGEDRMAPIEADDWRTKAAKEARDAARAEGKYPVLVRKYARVLKMRDAAIAAIAGCADLGGLTLADGEAERVLVWQEGEVACRARLDWLSNDRKVILDYKTTTDATPRAFTRQITRMGYHYQDEFYSRAVAALFGHRPKFVFLAQEDTAPHACSFHGCAPSLRAIAEQDVDYAVRTWKRCLALNDWPAHDQRIHWAEAMPWQMDATEERTGIPYDPAILYAGLKENDPLFPERH